MESNPQDKQIINNPRVEIHLITKKNKIKLLLKNPTVQEIWGRVD